MLVFYNNLSLFLHHGNEMGSFSLTPHILLSCRLSSPNSTQLAKMSGFASAYDLFTPDVGEMAFLADEAAPHPSYTRGFLLQEEERVPELIQRAY